MDPFNPVPWSFWQKALFRFFAIYFFLYTFPFPLDQLPVTDRLAEIVYTYLWMPLVMKAGAWLHISAVADSAPNGSGDTIWNYVQVLVLCSLSVVVWAIWSLAGRNAKHHSRLLYWMMVYVRYVLATAMLTYGWVKVFKSQFPSPPLTGLLQPYGESSPMRLAWMFMGYSDAYNLFTGGAEVLAGLLLFFRRTRLLGALVAVIVLANIVAINFCFDVPVKLYSVHLLAMAVFVLAPDVPSLYRFFLLHLPAIPTGKIRPFTTDPKRAAGLHVIKLLFVGYILYSGVTSSREAMLTYGDGAAKPPLWGIYQVEIFVKNADTLPPLLTDTVRWRRFVVSRPEWAATYSMNDRKASWNLRQDTGTRTITLVETAPGKPVYQFTYSQPDSAHLVLSGTHGSDSLRLFMRKEPVDSFLLLNRGFHWINESPFNR